jgi:hypothetical protein
MCLSSQMTSLVNPAGKLLGDKYKHLDPLTAKLEREGNRAYEGMRPQATTLTTPAQPLGLGSSYLTGQGW